MLRFHVDAVPISTVALFLGIVLLSDAAAQLSSHHTSATFFQHRTHLHLWPSCKCVYVYGLKKPTILLLLWKQLLVCPLLSVCSCQGKDVYFYTGSDAISTLWPHSTLCLCWQLILSLSPDTRLEWSNRGFKIPWCQYMGLKMISLKHARVTN